MGENSNFILGIETSCDETSVSIVRNGREVISNIIYSQIAIHQPYGGVVPEIASRNHIKKISAITDQAFLEAGLKYHDVDAVAVTYGPGLIGSLLVGLSFAKSFAYGIGKPLMGVNHIDAHICANYIGNEEVKPPFVTLVASGGHSHLILVEDYNRYKVLGQTRDDAAGEAFDKIARTLGLGYPGGPAIDKIALTGNPEAINFPRSYLEENSYDFSFSGLKSAVLNYLNSMHMKNLEYKVEDVAASFQMAVVEVLASKTVRAAVEYGTDLVCLSGGVACNSLLRKITGELCTKNGIALSYPSLELCTDNGAMVACAGYYKFINKEFSSFDITAKPNLKI
ncbi:MAG: tRNA (adenosine(37)-N6)-threonylcarbamoyltransferase complex transferase subunit TsaD [Eubacteriaceae bacterium]|nr:tRNA (adenosine(37)-N6)-threonylcarbamoyltransferase complex transferase subunit TsaD [Eubacteriaceae bacterium]